MTPSHMPTRFPLLAPSAAGPARAPPRPSSRHACRSDAGGSGPRRLVLQEIGSAALVLDAAAVLPGRRELAHETSDLGIEQDQVLAPDRLHRVDRPFCDLDPHGNPPL